MMKKTKKLVYIRRLAQTLSILFLVFVLWNTQDVISAFANPRIYFLADPFAMIITTIAERVIIPGMLITLFVLLLTFVFGRFFCGWICPLGTLMDLWAFIISMFKRKKNKENEPAKAKNIKYAILAVMSIFAVVGIQIAWTMDPITIFVRAFSLTIHPFIITVTDKFFAVLLRVTGFPLYLESFYYSLKEVFLGAITPIFPHTWLIFSEFLLIFILIFFKRRFWCRYLCPLGATFALAAKFSPFRRKAALCTKQCGICKNTCRMNAIRSDNSYINEECILCMDCIEECPNQLATFTFKK
ncbi:MAG: 4Fe-4S binding protein [Endomicrobiales bacterium]|nr:4Fe-4S binding protein [Endomicrobiales bacterium]